MPAGIDPRFQLNVFTPAVTAMPRPTVVDGPVGEPCRTTMSAVVPAARLASLNLTVNAPAPLSSSASLTSLICHVRSALGSSFGSKRT